MLWAMWSNCSVSVISLACAGQKQAFVHLLDSTALRPLEALVEPV